MDVLMLAAAELPTSVAYIAATAAATTIVVLATRRRARQGRGGAGPTTIASTSDSTVRRGSGSDEMRQLLIELQQFARETMAQIDNRTRKLEILIRDADERLARLRAQGSDESKLSTAPDVGDSRISSSLLDVVVDDGGDQVRSGEADGVSCPVSSSDAPAQSSPLDHSRVVELSESGMAPVDIARKLDRPTGEIELVLSLASATGK